MQTIIKLMGEKRKAMSRRMIKKKENVRKLDEFGFRKNFQIFIKLIILSGWYRGAFQVQGCSPGIGMPFSHNIKIFYVTTYIYLFIHLFLLSKHIEEIIMFYFFLYFYLPNIDREISFNSFISCCASIFAIY